MALKSWNTVVIRFCWDARRERFKSGLHLHSLWVPMLCQLQTKYIFQAVCCNDHEHCCPNGYKCNVAEQTCDKPGDLSLPWVQKIAALQKVTIQTTSSWSHPARIMCDPHTSCPRDTTCCLMNTHKWGCCPLPEVCTSWLHSLTTADYVLLRVY